MASFFSSFGKTYGDGMLQKKAQAHQDDLDQQGQYLQILHDAANSPAAQSWSDQQWKAYMDAVANTSEVKSQKDPKKSGIAGVLQKFTGGPKGGSNLSDKLQGIFGSAQGAGSPMTQTASAGASSPDAPAGVAISPTPLAPGLAGAPSGMRLPPDQLSSEASPLASTGSSSVGPMPESFQRRQPPPEMPKTVSGTPIGGPPKLTIGGSKVDIGQKPDFIMIDPATGHHVGHYVGRDGKPATIDYGAGMSEAEYLQDQREKARAASLKSIQEAKAQGNLPQMTALYQKLHPELAPEDAQKAMETLYVQGQIDKWGDVAKRHEETAKRLANQDVTIAQQQQKMALSQQRLLLAGTVEQRRAGEQIYKHTNDASAAPKAEYAALASEFQKNIATREQEANHIPNPITNPADTQAAKDARIADINKNIDRVAADMATKQTAIKALHDEANDAYDKLTKGLPAVDPTSNAKPGELQPKPSKPSPFAGGIRKGPPPAPASAQATSGTGTPSGVGVPKKKDDLVMINGQKYKVGPKGADNKHILTRVP